MAKVVGIYAATALILLAAGPLLWLRGGMGGLATALAGVWAVLMLYLVGLIITRLRRAVNSEEGRFQAQMAHFLAQQTDSESPGTQDTPRTRS